MHSTSNKKTREYYLAMLGMTGELVSQKAYEHAPTAATTAGDELRLMMKEKLMRYHKHEDGIRTFRICDPAGFSAIEGVDRRLLLHAELFAGKKGGRYPGSKSYRIKKRKESVLMLNLMHSGFIVDGAKLTKEKKILIRADDITSAEKIIKATPESAPLFLSGLLLKHRNSDVSLSRREMSISTGAVFSRGGIYNTYSISSANFRWYAAAEIAAASEILRLYEETKDIERRSDGRFRSIIYTDTNEIAGTLIDRKNKDKDKMNPVSIFRLTYLVPTEDMELAMDVTRMLTIPNWRLRSDKILGLSPSGKHDGVTNEGKKIYNLLCCNLAKTREIAGEIRKGSCKLVLHDWQKPLLEELYATEIDAMVLSPKHFKGLLFAVQEEDSKEREKMQK